MGALLSSKRAPLAQSYRDSCLAPDRVSNIDAMVADLITALSHGQITALEPTLVLSSENDVELRDGTIAPFARVQEKLIRLELMSIISKDTLIALIESAQNPKAQMTDWAKINAEVWRCGETRDLPFYKTSRFKEGVNAFIDGVTLRAVLEDPINATEARLKHVRTQQRLGFEIDPLTRSVIGAAVEFDGSNIKFVNPVKL